MPRTLQGNVSFEPPKDWEDLTIAAFSPRSDPKQTLSPSLKVWHEPLAEGATLKQHVNRTIVQLAKELAAFDLLENEETAVAGRQAFRLRCRFKSRWGPVEQSRVLVDPAGDPERAVTVFFLATKWEDAEAMRAELDRVLKTVEFAGGGGAVHRPAPAATGAGARTPALVPNALASPLRTAPEVAPITLPMAPPTIGAPPDRGADGSDNPSFHPPSMPMPGRTR